MPHSTTLPPNSVRAGFNYIRKPPPGERVPDQIVFSAGYRRQTYDRHEAIVHDIRASDEDFQVDTHGFELVPFESSEIPLEDDDAIRAKIYPEVQALIQKHTGCSDSMTFNHVIRRVPFQAALDIKDSEEPDEKILKVDHPSMEVHIDQSYQGADYLVEALAQFPGFEHLPGRTARTRFAIINVWKPIRQIRREPLAVCDARSVAEADLVPLRSVLKAEAPASSDSVVELWQVAYNPEHKWYWPSYMEPNEALLLKCFDSKTDGRARRAPHCAFFLPDSEGPPRESIEFRSLVFWEGEERE